MKPNLYMVRVKRPHTLRALAAVPVEADYPSTAKRMAGHILRGFAVQNDDFGLIAILYGPDGDPIGHARVIREGARYRGPNQTWKKHNRWGLKVDTPEERAAKMANMPRVNKVVWI